MDEAALAEDVDIDPERRRQILLAEASVERWTHWEALGIPWNAPASAAKDAYIERVRQQFGAAIQRVAFAAARGISANYHFDSCCLDNRGRVISAIIRDHEDAVIGAELGLNVPDGGKYSPSLVVSGNDERDHRPLTRRVTGAYRRPARGISLMPKMLL